MYISRITVKHLRNNTKENILHTKCELTENLSHISVSLCTYDMMMICAPYVVILSAVFDASLDRVHIEGHFLLFISNQKHKC